MTRFVRNVRGISIIEITIVLSVVAVLTAVAAPVAARTIDRARLTRATTDVTAIATAINSFVTEHTAFIPFTSTGLTGTNTVTIMMLVSDGDTPRQVSATGSNIWDDPVNPAAGTELKVDFLERHLITNTPGGTGAYSTSATTGWRGAYMHGPIDADPWGNRYAVNVLYFRTTAPVLNDVFVLSTGPDEEIDTAFTVNGARPGDDDLIRVVRRHSGLIVP